MFRRVLHTFQHPFQRNISERINFQVIADFVDGFVVSDQFFVAGEIDPCTSISLTHIAARSIPTVSYLFIMAAIFILVPTPSVLAIYTGFL